MHKYVTQVVVYQPIMFVSSLVCSLHHVTACNLSYDVFLSVAHFVYMSLYLCKSFDSEVSPPDTLWQGIFPSYTILPSRCRDVGMHLVHCITLARSCCVFFVVVLSLGVFDGRRPGRCAGFLRGFEHFL